MRTGEAAREGEHDAALQHDRVRTRTAGDVLRAIDGETADRLSRYADASPAQISQRLDALDREWDTDRAIELEAAIAGLAGLALARREPALLALPAIVGGALLIHSLTGWYPMLPVLRRLGVRSSREIERERFALKGLRGDFETLGRPESIDGVSPNPHTLASEAAGGPR